MKGFFFLRKSIIALDFGVIVQGTTSAAQTVTVSKTGASNFQPLTVNADPPFTVSGFTKAVSLRLSDPLIAPGMTGLKESSKDHLAAAATLPEQGGVPELAANVPLAAKVEMVMAAPLVSAPGLA